MSTDHISRSVEHDMKPSKEQPTPEALDLLARQGWRVVSIVQPSAATGEQWLVYVERQCGGRVERRGRLTRY